MKLKVHIPCCNRVTTVDGRMADESPSAPVDRKCPTCACWWRVDVQLKRSLPGMGAAIHAVTWTRVGTLK